MQTLLQRFLIFFTESNLTEIIHNFSKSSQTAQTFTRCHLVARNKYRWCFCCMTSLKQQYILLMLIKKNPIASFCVFVKLPCILKETIFKKNTFSVNYLSSNKQTVPLRFQIQEQFSDLYKFYKFRCIVKQSIQYIIIKYSKLRPNSCISKWPTTIKSTIPHSV